MNECKIVEDLLPLYTEELTNEEAAEFIKNHVENCEHCRKLLGRCKETVPNGEPDGKEFKMVMRKNMINMICRIVVVALLLFGVLYFGATKWFDYLQWWNGRAPVEQVVKAPVGNGEVILVGWETIEFTFHQWLADSETITFVYETDTGIRGLLDYHFPTETITDIN